MVDRGRILVVDHATPTPDRDSGSASAFSLMAVLARAGFAVSFVPHVPTSGTTYVASLEAAGVRVVRRDEWRDTAAAIAALSPAADVVLLRRASVAAHYLDVVRANAPSAVLAFHPVDLAFVRVKREARLTDDARLAAEVETIRDLELAMVRRSDATIVVSPVEARRLARHLPDADVTVLPILRPEVPRGPGPEVRRDVLFVGGYAHRPNVDAVLWFVREVWPKVLDRGYPHHLLLVGSETPDEVHDLASDTVQVLGHVPDMTPLLDAARVTVAPLRFGGGVKGKVVTSLAHGVPVVGTPVAVEGMGLQDQVDALVASEPDDLAAALVRLHCDDRLWERLAYNGRLVFNARFSEQVGGRSTVALFDRLVRSRVPTA